MAHTIFMGSHSGKFRGQKCWVGLIINYCNSANQLNPGWQRQCLSCKTPGFVPYKWSETKVCSSAHKFLCTQLWQKKHFRDWAEKSWLYSQGVLAPTVIDTAFPCLWPGLFLDHFIVRKHSLQICYSLLFWRRQRVQSTGLSEKHKSQHVGQTLYFYSPSLHGQNHPQNSYVSPLLEDALGSSYQQFTTNFLKLSLGTAKPMAQKRIWLSSFCSWLPEKIPGIRSQEILYFTQTLIKVGRNGARYWDHRYSHLWAVQFPVPLPAQPHKTPQGCDTCSAAVGRRGVRIPTSGRDDCPLHTSSWWGGSASAHHSTTIITNPL